METYKCKRMILSAFRCRNDADYEKKLLNIIILDMFIIMCLRHVQLILKNYRTRMYS